MNNIHNSKDQLNIFLKNFKDFADQIVEYDKLIFKLIGEINVYNKKNKTFFDSISAKYRKNYFRFYSIKYLPQPKGINNYYFQEVADRTISHSLKTNFMKKNPELRELTKLLIVTIRDRNKLFLQLSNFNKSISKIKPKLNLIKLHFQKELDL